MVVNGMRDIPIDDNSILGKCTRDTPDDSVDQYLKLLPAPFQRIPGTGCRKMVQVCYFIISVIVVHIFLRTNIYLNYVLGLCWRTKQLQEWTEAARCGAARLLHALLVRLLDSSAAQNSSYLPSLSNSSFILWCKIL